MMRLAKMLTPVSALALAACAAGPNYVPPLPVAALRGWDSERMGERLFDDRAVFRVKY